MCFHLGEYRTSCQAASTRTQRKCLDPGGVVLFHTLIAFAVRYGQIAIGVESVVGTGNLAKRWPSAPGLLEVFTSLPRF